MISPAWLAVFALNSLVNPGILIPWGPSVEPTGGAGVALPAGSCNFTTAVIFFAIKNIPPCGINERASA